MKKISDIKKEWLLDSVKKILEKGKSKADISRDLNVKPQFLNSLINGNRGITDQFIDKFIETYKLNQYALPLNKGELINESPPGYSKTVLEAQEKIIHSQQETIEVQHRYIKSLERDLAILQEKKEPANDGQKRKAG